MSVNDWSSCKNDHIWNPSSCDCEHNKACKIDLYLDIKNYCCEKNGKLVLECEDEILNTTETLINDNKLACVKSNFLIHAVSLIIICSLLLVVICVNCFLYKILIKTTIFRHQF